MVRGCWMKKPSFRELCGLHKDSQLIKQKQHLNPDLLTWKFRAFVVTRTYTYQRTCHLAWEDSLRAMSMSQSLYAQAHLQCPKIFPIVLCYNHCLGTSSSLRPQCLSLNTQNYKTKSKMSLALNLSLSSLFKSHLTCGLLF